MLNGTIDIDSISILLFATLLVAIVANSIIYISGYLENLNQHIHKCILEQRELLSKLQNAHDEMKKIEHRITILDNEVCKDYESIQSLFSIISVFKETEIKKIEDSLFSAVDELYSKFSKLREDDIVKLAHSVNTQLTELREDDIIKPLTTIKTEISKLAVDLMLVKETNRDKLETISNTINELCEDNNDTAIYKDFIFRLISESRDINGVDLFHSSSFIMRDIIEKICDSKNLQYDSNCRTYTFCDSKNHKYDWHSRTYKQII